MSRLQCNNGATINLPKASHRSFKPIGQQCQNSTVSMNIPHQLAARGPRDACSEGSELPLIEQHISAQSCSASISCSLILRNASYESWYPAGLLASALYLATTSLLCTMAASCACFMVPDKCTTWGIYFCPSIEDRNVTPAQAIWC